MNEIKESDNKLSYKDLYRKAKRIWEIKRWKHSKKKSVKARNSNVDTEEAKKAKLEQKVYDIIPYSSNDFFRLIYEIKSHFRNPNKQIARVKKEIPEIIIRPAKEDDYIEWLDGYIKKGGSPNYGLSYPMAWELDHWFVLKDDLIMVPLYGKDAIYIIIPSGINVFGDDYGQCKLYFMDSFTHRYNGEKYVPYYSDIEKLRNKQC